MPAYRSASSNCITKCFLNDLELSLFLLAMSYIDCSHPLNQLYCKLLTVCIGGRNHRKFSFRHSWIRKRPTLFKSLYFENFIRFKIAHLGKTTSDENILKKLLPAANIGAREPTSTWCICKADCGLTALE